MTPAALFNRRLQIDRFMSQCRALTNIIGNGVATVVISRWEKEVTPETLQARLRAPVSLQPKTL